MSKFSAGMPPSRPPGATSCRRSRIVLDRARRRRSSRGRRGGRATTTASGGVGGGGTGSASWTLSQLLPSPAPPPAPPRSSTTAVSGEPSPGGKCRSSASVPRLELVGFVSPWPKPSVPWLVRLPSASTTSSASTPTTIAPRAPPHQPGDPLPDVRRSLFVACADTEPTAASRASRRPEGALAEHRQQGGQQGEGGGEHRRDPDRQDRAEPVRRLEVGDEQDQHRRDHRPGRGGDRRRGLAQRRRQRLARRGLPLRSSSR